MTTAVATTQTSNADVALAVSETVISEPAVSPDANSIFRTASAGAEIALPAPEAEERIVGTTPHSEGVRVAPAPDVVASEMARRAEESPVAILSVVTVRPTLWERTAPQRAWVRKQLTHAKSMLWTSTNPPAAGNDVAPAGGGTPAKGKFKTYAKRVVVTSMVGGFMLAFAAVETRRAELRGELSSSQALVEELRGELADARAAIVELSDALAAEMAKPWWKRLDRW